MAVLDKAKLAQCQPGAPNAAAHHQLDDANADRQRSEGECQGELPLSSAATTEDMYAVLGVDVNASSEEVHQAFRRLVLLHHPDRSHNPIEAQKFHLITAAGSVLRDRYRRMMYDMQKRLRHVPEAEICEVLVKLRHRAFRLVENMAETVSASRESETDVNGVIILKGLYGDLRHRGDLSLPPARAIDVTVPLQCLVHSSELIEVSTTKMFLDGFYDPCMYHDKQLFIRYMFKGAVHQVLYEDKDPVHIPMRSHLVNLSEMSEEYLYQTKFTFPRRSRAERRRRAQEELKRQRLMRTGKLAVATVSLLGVLFFLRDHSPRVRAVLNAWQRSIHQRT